MKCSTQTRQGWVILSYNGKVSTENQITDPAYDPDIDREQIKK